MITKKQHFSLSLETSEAIWPRLEEFVVSGITPSLQNAIHSDMEYYMRLRRGKLLLRPLLARYCLEATSTANWLDFVPLLVAVELLNISTYQSNFCFDEKAGVKSTAERNNQFICSMLTFSSTIAVVRECQKISSEHANLIINLLTSANHEVYEGQYSDLNILTIDRLDDPEITSYGSFKEIYLQRCNLIAGSTFRACAITALAQNPAPEVLQALNSYLISLGAAAQVVNDLGDFIPHPTKTYSTPFADIRLGRLTLPIYLLAKAGVPIRALREEFCKIPDSGSCQEVLIDAIKRYRIEPLIRRFIKTEIFPKIWHALGGLRNLLGGNRVAPLYFAVPYIYESRLLRYFRSGSDQWLGSKRSS